MNFITKSRFTRRALFTLRVFCLVLITLLLACIPARAQVTGAQLIAVTNLPSIINVGSVSNTTSYIRLTKNSGLGLQMVFNASAGTSNVWVYLAPSVDGTNYASRQNQWLWKVAAAESTTDVVGQTNWSAAQLRGLHSILVAGITNSQGGTGIVTNKGMLFNRPIE